MKLEITKVFSTVDADFRQKLTTKMTSCNGQQKKVKLHGKKLGKGLSNYIKNQARKVSSMKNIRPSKLVLTIAQIKNVSNSKVLGNNELQREHYDQENQL